MAFVFFLSCSEAGTLFVLGVHSSKMYCVTVNGSILTQFLTIFQNRQPFQMHYIILIFVTRWRHNFCEIAVKKLQKVQN